MSPDEIKLFIAEIELRFSARASSDDANYVSPDYRVSRSEMIKWASDVLNIKLSFVDFGDPDLHRAIVLMNRRLRRKYPDENWLP